MPPTFAPREHVEVRARKLNQLARDVSSSGDAAEHAADAQAALTAAQAAALAAATARVGSEAARDGSVAAQTAANLAVTAAGIAKDAAIDAANDSATHADTAFGHATAAQGSANIAAVHATEAGVAVISATAQANLATLKANEADTLAQSAALTATSASVSADESATSASAAATSELNASVSSAAAGTSATAAATSATSASASQSAAGASATSASNSANTATVQAGAASSSASAASSSAANASTSAASASQSALLSATVGSRAFNANPDFGMWTNAGSWPDGWSGWSTTGTLVRDAGFISRYGVRLSGGAATDGGFVQAGLPKVGAGYSVIEWTVELVSGDFSGAGVYAIATNAGGTYTEGAIVDFWSEHGAGTVGQIYSKSRLVSFTNTTSAVGILHAMTGWTGFARGITAKNIRWLRLNWRPATEAEIRDQTVLTPLTASVATNSLAIADVQGRTEAYWEVTAVAGGRAKLRVFADANGGGGVDIEGDTRISGSLLVGGTITASKFLTDAGVDLAAIVPGSLNWKLNSGAPTAYSGNYWNGTSYDPHINTGVINGTGASAISTTHLCRITAQFSSSGATGFGGTTYNVILTVYYRINGGAWTSTGVTASDTRVGGGYTTKTATGTFAAPSAGTIEFAYGITSSATAGLGVTVIDHSIAIEATFWK